MYRNKKIIAIIPARSGSKGLPNKNIKKLLDIPLIGWTIQQASKSKLIDKTVVSTDCKKIANVAESFGITVEKLRPAYLAQDDTPMFDVLEAVLNDQEKDYHVTVLLEPTSPLRKNKDIDRGIKKIIDNWEEIDSVVSLGKVHMENPEICKKIDEGNVKPYNKQSRNITARQQLDEVYFPYGVFYGAKTEKLLKSKSFYQEKCGSILIERWQNYEVDDIFDFICIESILKYRQKGE